MWARFRKIKDNSSELIDLSSDVMENATRNSILVVTIVAGAWAIFITLLRSGDVPLLLVLAAVASILVLVWLLAIIEQHILLVHIGWFTACFAVITLGFAPPAHGKLPYLSFLVPVLTVILSGLPAAVVSCILSSRDSTHPAERSAVFNPPDRPHHLDGHIWRNALYRCYLGCYRDSYIDGRVGRGALQQGLAKPGRSARTAPGMRPDTGGSRSGQHRAQPPGKTIKP